MLPLEGIATLTFQAKLRAFFISFEKGVFCLVLMCSGWLVSIEARSSYRSSDPGLEEARIDIEDLKHALKIAQVEWNLLDERLRKQEALQPSRKESTDSTPLASLEKKVIALEKLFEKISSDVRALNTQTTQLITHLSTLEQELAVHEKRLMEVAKLKNTLTSISQAITPPSQQYRVKAGDSLEKIAKEHRISVELLKKMNRLTGDKIVIGQELKVRDDTH